MRPLGLHVLEARGHWVMGETGVSKCLHMPPQHNSWHPRAPPQPGMPAWIVARVVSPGPLPHVRWQRLPSCLHSSAVKTATLGPGLAGTPLSVRACVLVRVCRDTPAAPASRCPYMGVLVCARLCPGHPRVPGRVRVQVCMGGTDPRVDIHGRMRGAGGLRAGGDLWIARAPAALWTGACADAASAVAPWLSALARVRLRWPGMASLRLSPQPAGRWRKQEKGVQSPSARLGHTFPTHTPR